MAFAGIITKMELEHDGKHVLIPASNIPQGDRGLVHIWGRNDTASAQQMGIGWVIFDPDGVVVEEYNEWEAWPYTGAGDEHHFIGGRFDITKVGTYIISVILKMSPPPAYPTLVDTYYGTLLTVEAAVLPAQTLEIDITPIGKGYVITSPASLEGRTEWHNGDTGTFPYGTDVVVTAVPVAGYVFEKWSDEIIGGVSYYNPEHVQLMVEHRAVKAHFRTEDEPDVETLEVDITPVGKGYVTTSPASYEGKTVWHNDETGNFLYGTKVQVTAHPEEGYIFEKWSDEIIGGVSYNNPEYVQLMVEHRGVKAHFREEEEEPVTGKGELTAIVIHWQQYTDLLPPASIETRGSYEIHPVCKNIATEAISFRVEAVVTKPSGAVVRVVDIDGWPYTGAGKEFKPTLNMGNVDEVGVWTAIINLYDHKANELLDSWSGDLLIVGEAPVNGDFLSSIIPLLVIGLMVFLIPKLKEGFG